MSITPTTEQIEDAKQYLRDRLEAELSMQHNLDYYLTEAANRLTEVCLNNNASSFDDARVAIEVENILAWLRDMIRYATLTLASSSPKVDDSTEAEDYANREIEDMTFDDRLDVYMGVFQEEIADYISMRREKVLGGSSGHAARIAALTMPLWSKDWRGYTHKGMSAFNLLNRLTRNTIADTWMHELLRDAEAKGSVGYIVMRGSSYPCDSCDEVCGLHFYIEPMPIPTHANCKCFAIPI